MSMALRGGELMIIPLAASASCATKASQARITHRNAAKFLSRAIVEGRTLLFSLCLEAMPVAYLYADPTQHDDQEQGITG
jgi:hypothetical protein